VKVDVAANEQTLVGIPYNKAGQGIDWQGHSTYSSFALLHPYLQDPLVSWSF
jgi:hypothetical protein